jgi:tetratricopeptide (TPR) repeat protein
VLTIRAEAHLTLGEPAEALVAAREAIERGSVGGNRYPEAQAQIVLAGALLAEETVPRTEIESALERAEELVESIAARSLSPRILEMRGRVAAALGDKPAAERALSEALDLFRAIGATGHAERLTRELGA